MQFRPSPLWPPSTTHRRIGLLQQGSADRDREFRCWALFLNGSKVVCQFEDPGANECFGRFGAMGLLRSSLREIPHISVSPHWHIAGPMRTNRGTAINDSHDVIEGEFSPIPRGQIGEVGRPDLEEHSQWSVALSIKSVTNRTGVAAGQGVAHPF